MMPMPPETDMVSIARDALKAAAPRAVMDAVAATVVADSAGFVVMFSTPCTTL